MRPPIATSSAARASVAASARSTCAATAWHAAHLLASRADTAPATTATTNTATDTDADATPILIATHN